MRVTVLFFAAMRERAAVDRLEINLQDHATIADLQHLVVERFPQLKNYVEAASYARNAEYAKSSQTLKDGDEIAIIPPISGG